MSGYGVAVVNPAQREANAIERAKGEYAADVISLAEYERRVEYARAGFPHTGGTVIC